MYPETSANRSRIMVWLISITFVAVATWSNFAVLDEIVRGPGKVIPSSRTQVVQSLEGGILAEVMAWEGQIVSKGAALARLDDTKFKGAFQELETQITALEARLHRLNRELTFAQSLDLPDSVAAKDPELARSESQLFEARRVEYVTSISSFAASIELQEEEVAMLRDLSEQNLIPRVELLKAEKQLTQLESEKAGYEAEYILTRSEESSQTLTELTQMRANLATRADQLTRTSLFAPVRGIVNNVGITTIGGVVAPGDAILELTPLDDELRVEARISPKDIAFVSPNMPATIKLTAYDYTIYGSFAGKVVHISSDTFEDENSRDFEPYYKVLVQVDADTLVKDGETIEIRPGMLAEAELNVGSKTVLQYLLKPLFKASEAFREI